LYIYYKYIVKIIKIKLLKKKIYNLKVNGDDNLMLLIVIYLKKKKKKVNNLLIFLKNKYIYIYSININII